METVIKFETNVIDLYFLQFGKFVLIHGVKELYMCMLGKQDDKWR